MNQKRRTEITIETHKVTIIRQPGRQPVTRDWCQDCAGEVDLLSSEQAAALTGLSTRALCRQVEAGRLHFRETADGRLFICLNSLLTENPSQQLAQALQSLAAEQTAPSVC